MARRRGAGPKFPYSDPAEARPGNPRQRIRDEEKRENASRERRGIRSIDDHRRRIASPELEGCTAVSALALAERVERLSPRNCVYFAGDSGKWQRENTGGCRKTDDSRDSGSGQTGECEELPPFLRSPKVVSFRQFGDSRKARYELSILGSSRRRVAQKFQRSAVSTMGN